jgi:hypothetical protein
MKRKWSKDVKFEVSQVPRDGVEVGKIELERD